jgi:hypothetical protein
VATLRIAASSLGIAGDHRDLAALACGPKPFVE